MKYKRCRCERCNLYWDEEIQSTNDEVRSTNNVQEMYDVRTTMHHQAIQVIAILILVIIGVSLAIIIMP